MILIFFLEEGYKYVLPIGNTSMLLTTNKYGSVFSRGVVHRHGSIKSKNVISLFEIQSAIDTLNRAGKIKEGKVII